MAGLTYESERLAANIVLNKLDNFLNGQIKT